MTDKARTKQHYADQARIASLEADNARLREALELADATIRRLKPPVPYDSTQGTRDVISAALAGVQS